jgi:hypothetical protein
MNAKYFLCFKIKVVLCDIRILTSEYRKRDLVFVLTANDVGGAEGVWTMLIKLRYLVEWDLEQPVFRNVL